MTELSRVSIIPIIRQATKSIVGVLNCGSIKQFNGTETSFTLPSTKTVPLTKWVPDSANSTGQNNMSFVMAYVIDEPTYKSNAWKGYAEFVPVSELASSTRFVQSAGVVNQTTVTPGSLLDALSKKSLRYS